MSILYLGVVSDTYMQLSLLVVLELSLYAKTLMWTSCIWVSHVLFESGIVLQNAND